MSAYPFSPSPERSRIMAAIRSRDTKPEMLVRSLLRALGFSGYRLHRKDLPGKPDIAYLGRRKAIFVHGCFWHGHTCKMGARMPKVNEIYWSTKIARNRDRDAICAAELAKLGWYVLVIWECELRNLEAASDRLDAFMRSSEIR